MKPGSSLPLGLFTSSGVGAREISPLLWGLIWLSIAVAVIIAIAVVTGCVVRARGHRDGGHRDAKAIVREGASHGLWWIYGGVSVSTLILLAFTGWTVAVMADISRPPTAVAFTINVAAHQWWWSAHYGDTDRSKAFTTANEIHIPVGLPVHFVLTSPDVIHSFWVPALGGKTDVIPGRANQMWLEAEKSGVYRGQCSEYCGLQHAEMAFYIIAEPKAQFEAWRAAQQAPAAAATTEDLQTGLAHFRDHCGKCHTVRGTAADGAKGPDLTHLMSRSTIAAGMLINNIGNLSGWIAHPQGIKPGALMPDIAISGPEFQSVLAYVETLR